jgi:nitrogen fixation NifU-like protein
MYDEGLQDLYQELILDHNARPHNFGALAHPSHHAHGLNPLCGDDIEVFLALEGGKIEKASFNGHGCAISKASASMMTDAVKDMSSAQALELFEIFHRLVTGVDVSESELEKLGKVTAFAGVKEFPARVKCASLAWHTLKAALNNAQGNVSTE